MKKQTISSCMIALVFSSSVFAQVGINTPSPKSTMDISVIRNAAGDIVNNSQWIGLQAPRLTRGELTAITSSYTTDQNGALIYITDSSSGNNIGQRVNIDSVGYYYFNGSLWQKIKDTSADISLYTNNGTLAANRTITENGNTLTFTGTAEGANKFINTSGTSSQQKSPLQIVDGGQGEGKVLLSDTNGNVRWQMYRVQKTSGTIGAGVNIPFNATNFRTTGTSITLSPGKWEVSVSMLLPVYTGTLASSDWVWLKSSFSDTNANVSGIAGLSADIVGGKLISGLFSGPKNNSANPKFNMMTGSLVIVNNTGADKTYFYVAGLCDSEFAAGTGKATRFELFGGTDWSENIITAMPVQ
ncbi:hypothetical protein [Chryseobacterium contaminans]|uniref:hypothetical protein n=1 Tax=Chryseobacterium contaminans TaxID=1423959 RepID=UPI003019CA84